MPEHYKQEICEVEGKKEEGKGMREGKGGWEGGKGVRKEIRKGERKERGKEENLIGPAPL